MHKNDILGKPYQSGSRGPETYDCWGLIMKVAQDNGIFLPDYDINPDDSNAVIILTRIEKDQGKWVKWPDGKRPKENLVVAFQLARPGDITHVGITIGDGLFIHCIQKKGVCIEPLARFQNFIEGYYEYKK